MYNLNYIIYFISGGFLFTLFKYLSDNNIKLSCILPVIPIFFPISLYIFHYDNKNIINRYISGSIYAVFLYLLFLTVLYFTYNKYNNINNSLTISFIIYFILLYIIWTHI